MGEYIGGEDDASGTCCAQQKGVHKIDCGSTA